MDPDGKNNRDVSLTCGTEPAWRPDGNAIAYSCAEGGTSDIYLVNADGTGAVNVTNTPGEFEEHPSWSPDGSKIVFEANNTGGGLFISNADGSNRTQLTTVSTDEYAAWSPVGATIAFARWNGSTRQILTNTADGNTVTEVTPAFGNIDQTPTWSPDGSQISFVRFLGTSYDLYQVAAAGGAPTRRTTGQIVVNPEWTRP
jgi:TolB protein